MNALKNKYDESIESVSPVLIEGYERTSLPGGRILSWYNEELKRNNIRGQFWDKLVPRAIVGCAIFLPTGIVIMIRLGIAEPAIICLLGIFFFFVMVVLISLTDKKKLEILCAINNSVVALEGFDRVSSLFPHPPGILLCESTIRQELLFAAVEVAKGEQEFKTLRLELGNSDEVVVHAGLKIQRRRQAFEDKIKAAASFGLDCDAKKIFAQAQKILTH